MGAVVPGQLPPHRSPHTRPTTTHPQLGVLLEWCRIRQAGLIGQLRAGFCAHSGLDQLADLAVRAAAALRWEPELRTMQGEQVGGWLGCSDGGRGGLGVLGWWRAGLWLPAAAWASPCSSPCSLMALASLLTCVPSQPTRQPIHP